MPSKGLLSDSYVNTKRQVSFDYLKALSILFMVIIHVYEEHSVFSDGTDAGLFGEIIEFLGGPLAAPLFMFSMGIGMVYSSTAARRSCLPEVYGCSSLLMC